MKIQTTKDAVPEGNGPRGNVELPRALADHRGFLEVVDMVRHAALAPCRGIRTRG